MCPFDFKTSFSGLESRRLGNGTGVGGGGRLGGSGASWGVSFRNKLRRSYKLSQEKAPHWEGLPTLFPVSHLGPGPKLNIPIVMS